MANVQAVLSKSESGDSSVIANEAYNGFYACISALRHVFRYDSSKSLKV
jgi:hypothetical protein